MSSLRTTHRDYTFTSVKTRHVFRHVSKKLAGMLGLVRSYVFGILESVCTSAYDAKQELKTADKAVDDSESRLDSAI